MFLNNNYCAMLMCFYELFLGHFVFSLKLTAYIWPVLTNVYPCWLCFLFYQNRYNRSSKTVTIGTNHLRGVCRIFCTDLDE